VDECKPLPLDLLAIVGESHRVLAPPGEGAEEAALAHPGCGARQDVVPALALVERRAPLDVAHQLNPILYLLLHGAAAPRRRRGVAAQVEIESKIEAKLRAVYHNFVSSA
jgi:hypothetical protein